MSILKQRIYLLDALRGIAVCGMIIHHGFFSAELVFGYSIAFFNSPLFTSLQFLFASVFILISGICANLSRNLLKRGALVFGLAMLISLVTVYFLPLIGIYETEIYFGILHLLGLSMIVTALAKKLINKTPYFIGLIASIIVFIAYYFYYLTEPVSKYFILMVFGIIPTSFLSADYYPFFPYFFLFLSGVFLGRISLPNRMPSFFYTLRLTPFELVGKYALYIYLFHQPIIFSIMSLIYNFSR